ncbi:MULTISPECIES: GGDEF domain-containing protein [Pseudomonas]|jgi:diguanylate cyclase (GGDEF)-like protein|uniref:diguanylate cyclase n=1 Tax=Pseudomonas fluorescens TaxID=294 RepID=A0AAE2DK45_PSEFL|nr:MULTISPECIES: GGDEF domain-containing protein [Pseudomonas]KIF60577.1 diguanylate cyclase [Pseudomonas fluorescens]TFA86559.1 diguanylate cyclase (GGDEF)-like protein [Pseudomonas sp. LAIL14HWK12:I2]SCZ38001.1 diguanylate cyclase (GGDEF) domain-containing protein [Pseudomonas sp. NFIX46]SDB46068.1 diguanylate cyclase (GGDEF) domain-containing protein [Pseudomonas putida]SFQ91975.1 diguanylate cyclase (GGDEF) domain-containing protein [Pseudomonas sp. NFIX49]
MYKTIEDEVLKKTAPAELWSEFIQHEFERLHSFCLLIYLASIGIWLAFDLIVSFIGNQGFTWRSMVFIAAFAILAVVLMFTRKARHFDWLNLTFVVIITLGIRMVIDGLPPTFHGIWLVLAAATTLYSASVLPLSRWSFFGAQAITWLVLNPFMNTGIDLLELKGVMTIAYSVFLCALTIYTFLKLREAKLYNYIMSKLLLDQAYNDTLTEIPNRRSFMSRAGKTLQAVPREHDHYLAMIDIDNFKKVNDVYGHDIGDEVLKRIAADIKTVMSRFEYARLGGEEFAIYLAGVRREDVEALAGELCRVVREQPTRHPVTISIGLARVEDGDTLNQALIKADEALYESKHTGKDRYTFHQ